MSGRTRFPALKRVETTPIQRPTLQGIATMAGNAIIVLDWTAINYRTAFVATGTCLWLYPVIFTWPFKGVGNFVLYLLGFEKGKIRSKSMASSYQRRHLGGYIEEGSPFAHFQSSATRETPGIPPYARVLGWIAGALVVRSLFL